MPTHDPDATNKKNDPSPGYETSDASVRDTTLFLIAIAAMITIVFVLAFGVGKLINKELARQDGPTNKWSRLAGVKPNNFESDPGIQQQQLRQMVQRFPTPRLQTDDGNMDVAEMHAREDMLLNYYSWVNQQKQTVRIPITRAMQLLAQRGLPVEGQLGTQEQAMFGDGSQVVTAPLTDGFARTGPELQMIETREQRMEMGELKDTRASLSSAH